jgi:ParB family chromosome partitioning protein
MTKRRALGKGLAALIPEDPGMAARDPRFLECPVEAIEPNPYQPRQHFQGPELEELVRSVKEKGIVTPLLVSKSEAGFQLIAGERRWRAAQRAGLQTVPVVVRETTPIESLELALVENIHRKDLNPIEEAAAYRKWMEDGHITQGALAKALGKERSTITNLLRLLKLPSSIQQDLIDGRLSTGHGRVLAGIREPREQRRLRDAIVKNDLSVRQAEALAKKKRGPTSAKRKPSEQETYLQSLAEDLKRALGTKVAIRKKGRGGRITISYYSDDELGRLLDLLT